MFSNFKLKNLSKRNKFWATVIFLFGFLFVSVFGVSFGLTTSLSTTSATSTEEHNHDEEVASTLPYKGQGTMASPYQISTEQELNELVENIAAGNGDYISKYYILTNDIVLENDTVGVCVYLTTNVKDYAYLHYQDASSFYSYNGSLYYLENITDYYVCEKCGETDTELLFNSECSVGTDLNYECFDCLSEIECADGDCQELICDGNDNCLECENATLYLDYSHQIILDHTEYNYVNIDNEQAITLNYELDTMGSGYYAGAEYGYLTMGQTVNIEGTDFTVVSMQDNSAELETYIEHPKTNSFTENFDYNGHIIVTNSVYEGEEVEITEHEHISSPTLTASFSGSGTSASPYLISSAAQLQELATLINNGDANFTSKYYRLTVDITVSGSFTPIGAMQTTNSLVSTTVSCVNAANYYLYNNKLYTYVSTNKTYRCSYCSTTSSSSSLSGNCTSRPYTYYYHSGSRGRYYSCCLGSSSSSGCKYESSYYTYYHSGRLTSKTTYSCCGGSSGSTGCKTKTTQVNCSTCGGDGKVTCSSCGGKGYTTGGWTGKTKYGCGSCGGSGGGIHIGASPYRPGSGQRTCSSCGGSGKKSTTTRYHSGSLTTKTTYSCCGGSSGSRGCERTYHSGSYYHSGSLGTRWNCCGSTSSSNGGTSSSYGCKKQTKYYGHSMSLYKTTYTYKSYDTNTNTTLNSQLSTKGSGYYNKTYGFMSVNQSVTISGQNYLVTSVGTTTQLQGYKQTATNRAFAGNFDGNGHTITISGMTAGGDGAYETQSFGIFGYNTGTIRNLTVANSSTINTSSRVLYGGLIVGYNAGTVTNCSASGSLSITNNNNGYTILNRGSAFTQSNIYVGGAVGYNSGTISQVDVHNATLNAVNNMTSLTTANRRVFINEIAGYQGTNLSNVFYWSVTKSATGTQVSSGSITPASLQISSGANGRANAVKFSSGYCSSLPLC